MNDPHFTLAGYELLGKLGEGGMAVVWKARQLSLDRLVAIKTLAPQWLQDPDALARFRQEAQASARLKHSGIVQVFDAGETKDAVYYVMEYVHGYTLADRIDRKGPLDEATALQVALGVAMALEYAWETARIIHCDIKPDNLMIDRDGTVKVADLGLARALGQKLGAADRDFIVGTPNYISPEQARGEQELDCRTDIYALGATLYHMVTGRLPFGETPGTAPLERQQSDFLLDPLDLNPKLTSPLAALIEKMMVKDSRQRTASWAEVLTDIQEVQDGFLPAGELPAQGLSTIMRGEWRAAHPGKRRSQRAARKKIVISSAVSTSAAVVTPTGLPAAAGVLLALAILAGAIIAGYFLLRAPAPTAPEPGPPISTNAPEHSQPPAKYKKSYKLPTARPPAPPEGAHPTAPLPPPRTAPVEPPEGTPPVLTQPPLAIETNGAFHSPHYLRAVRFFNYAFELYRTYRGPEMTLPVFNRIELACRQAMNDFKACREMTTEPETIEQHLMSCNRLLASARLSTKMARPGAALPANLPPLPSLELPAAGTPPPPPPKIILPKPDRKPPPAAVSEAALAAAWKQPPAQRPPALTDFRDLLALYPLEDENLAAGKELLLYDRVAYGMPARDAARLFKQPIGERLTVTSPLFPPDLYAYYLVDIPPDNGCTLSMLVVDPGDRVVAVQLINDLPGTELALPPALFQSRWRCYDFMRASEKTDPQQKIGYRVKLAGRLARIESELATNDRTAPLGLGAARTRSILYLPQALALRIFNRLDLP